MKRLFIYTLLFTSLFYLSSCYKDNLAKLAAASGGTAVCDTSGTISYAADIVPILQANCSINNSSCHSAGGNASGYNFSTYPGLSAEAANGDLINAITWTGAVAQMPQGGAQLSACDIAIIKKWIDAGHLNN